MAIEFPERLARLFKPSRYKVIYGGRECEELECSEGVTVEGGGRAIEGTREGVTEDIRIRCIGCWLIRLRYWD